MVDEALESQVPSPCCHRLQGCNKSCCPSALDGPHDHNCRMNATSCFFSSAVNFVSRIRLKNSTVSSSVNKRPSCKYGGDSLMPRRGNVLIVPSFVANRPLIMCGLKKRST